MPSAAAKAAANAAADDSDDDDYEQEMRALAFERRAAAGERTKTPEEHARAERERRVVLVVAVPRGGGGALLSAPAPTTHTHTHTDTAPGRGDEPARGGIDISTSAERRPVTMTTTPQRYDLTNLFDDTLLVKALDFILLIFENRVTKFFRGAGRNGPPVDPLRVPLAAISSIATEVKKRTSHHILTSPFSHRRRALAARRAPATVLGSSFRRDDG